MSTLEEITDWLVAQGLAGGSTAWDLVRRRISDDDPMRDAVVVVGEDGGPAPEMASATGIGDSAQADIGIHMTVRAGPWDGDASAAKAQEIISALHGLTAAQLVSGGKTYLRIAAQTAEPIFVGFDGKNRPLHTVAFRLLTEL